MRISLNWLREFIDIPGDVEEIASTLTMLGLEAESGVNPSGLRDIIVGEVTSCIKHPNADRLNLCDVFDGEATFPVVCGAPNVDKGQKVAFAPVGAKLPDEFKINKAKIRGEVSEGMICSERELGISDEHEGIMVLKQSARCGQSFLDYLEDINDQIELDITPNRPDCFSHLGVARDLAVKLNLEFKTPDYSARQYETNEAEQMISLSFEDTRDCPRYIAGIVKNVNVGESPDWLKKRLESIGQRSINNIVDISNFVLMEMGHPTHMFDYDKLDSNEILVRRGKEKEVIITLDGVNRRVSSNELLITNGKEPIAVAGVMGDLDSAVTSKTTSVLIESAYFDAPTIRRGSKELGLATDASKRFERGADPNGAEKAFWRTLSLLEEIAGAEWVPGIVDHYPNKVTQNEITLTRDKLDILSGSKISDDFIVNCLKGIGCNVNGKSNSWICSAPSWRPDIEREVDLIEEIIRFYGYDNVPSKDRYKGIMTSEKRDPQSSISKIISIFTGFGFTQVFNNSLQSKDVVSILDFTPVEMVNPLSESMSHLRNSLFPGLMNTIDFNLKNSNPDLMLFELGNVFEKQAPGLEGIIEKFQFAGVIHGEFTKTSIHRSSPRISEFYVLKGIIEAFFKRLNVNGISFASVDTNEIGLLDSFEILTNDKLIGHLGTVSQIFTQKMKLDVKQCFGFQFDLNFLLKLADRQPDYKSTVNFPIVQRDINFVLDDSIRVGHVIDSINKNGGGILIHSEPTNIFRHDTIGEEKKAITIRLKFQSNIKTLEDKDVNHVIDKIIRVISNEYSAKLR